MGFIFVSMILFICSLIHATRVCVYVREREIDRAALSRTQQPGPSLTASQSSREGQTADA